MPKHTAAEVITLANGHIAILLGRNWPAIEELLSESEEVAVNAKIVITERTPEAGEHSDVDHRVKTTISFSKKVSDSTESALEDPSNAPLTCPHGKTLAEFCQQCADEGEANLDRVFVPPLDQDSRNVPVTGDGSDVCQHDVSLLERCAQCDTLKIERGIPVNPGRFPEAGDNAAETREAREVIEHAAQPIGTSIAAKLAVAAQGVTLVPVVIDFPEGFTGDKYRALWRKAAKKQGWNAACIDLIGELAAQAGESRSQAEDETDAAKQRVLDVLKAHSISTAG